MKATGYCPSSTERCHPTATFADNLHGMEFRRRSGFSATVHEVATLWTRTVRERTGFRWALVRRARELIGVEQLESRILELSTIGVATEALAEKSASARAESEEAQIGALTAEVNTLRRRLEARERRSDFTEWVSSVPLRREPLVSVILTTLGTRPTGLRQALEAISRQSYSRFEVIVVSPNGDVLDGAVSTDPRFREVRESALGNGRYRNVGLREAGGEYITYADDDNTMGPQWLRAVVWCLSTDSETDVVYGARLHEQPSGATLPEPAFWWFEEEWRPSLLEEFSPMDTGVMAHRAGLTGARWDEQLPSCVDWDFAIRLSSSGRVKALPVRACTFTTSSPGRITTVLNTSEVRAEVRRRAREARRLRVLGVSHSFPRLSEWYIESELAALGPSFDVAVASEHEPLPGVETSFQHLGSVVDGMETHQPDLIVVHCADVAVRIRPILAGHQIPYAVRVHSYDLALAQSQGFEEDPLCLGLWVYPEHQHRFRRAHTLPALVHDAHKIPQFPNDRSGVVFTSGCLPKRNWDEIAHILGSLADVERTAILATCHGSEDLLAPVVARLTARDSRINVRCDVPHLDVLRSLTNASSLLHSCSLTHPMGNPRSVVEAWLCGAIPVMPDEPGAHAFAQDHARYFTDADQAVELIRSINTGGPAIDKERLANMDHAREFYASASVLHRFSTQLRESYIQWSSARA